VVPDTLLKLRNVITFNDVQDLFSCLLSLAFQLGQGPFGRRIGDYMIGPTGNKLRLARFIAQECF